MEKYTVFMDQKNQYSENEYTTQNNLDSMQSLSSYQRYFFFFFQFDFIFLFFFLILFYF